MLEVVPYELSDIKNELKKKTIDELGISDAEYEGSNVSQLINLLAYSNVINNTNFTFGLNEMFITQAQDRKNVIKHARQMGYINKRKTSYQYKIKLKVLKSGLVTLDKYTNFSSDGKNYVYMGEAITDVYGTYSYIKLLNNEYNNGIPSLFNEESTNKNNYIITEEGQACYIHEKESIGTPRLLLESIDDEIIPVYSQLPQDLYIWKFGDKGYETSNGYRSFEKIGTVDTFLYDPVKEEFKIQITESNPGDFPIFSEMEYDTTLINTIDGKLTLDTPTENIIKYINEVTLISTGEKLDINSLTIGINNFTFIEDEVPIEEVFTDMSSTNIIQDNEYNISIESYKDIIDGSLGDLSIEFIDGRTRTILNSDLTVENNNVKLNYQTTALTSNLTVSDSNITTIDIISQVNSISTLSGTLISNYSINDNVITLLDESGNPTTIYDGEELIIEVDYFETLDNIKSITIRYSYKNTNLLNSEVKVNYSYDVNSDGYLDKKFFFSDLRGEYPENEVPFNASTNPNGWDGFYASSYNTETSVLTFDVSGDKNKYVRTKENGVWKEAKKLNEVMVTPFKKTRFSTTERHEDVEGNVTFDFFNEDYCFASIENIETKNEIELIVKEGSIKRYNDTDDEGNFLYPELTVKATEDIVNAGHFIIQGEDIENDGIEIYVTRVLPSGIIEKDELWKRRDYLLSENDGIDEKTFVVLPHLEYEDYINIYTRYAGTGIDMSLDFIMKLNLFSTNGTDGKTNSLIEPVDNENFEAINYIEETLTPHVLYIEGNEEESTENIRENAPLFSNTANRAVTKNDYLTITQSQSYVDQAEIWGGEDHTPEINPGNVYISLVPFSRPQYFKSENNASRFYLDNIDDTELFYPTYYQITGQERYHDNQTEAASNDTAVLFNILDSYKILTIQLNYIKTSYLDYTLDINVLKYKFGQTIEETNKDIFAKIENFFKEKIESYNTTYYSSTLIKYIDSVLGDDFGIEFDTRFSVDLYDNYYYPDQGTFRNDEMKQLTPDENGNVGWDDRFVSELMLDMPINDMFDEDIIVNGKIETYGKMKVENLVNVSTQGFIIPNDELYMMLDDGTFISFNNDGTLEDTRVNSSSQTINISIMYTKDRSKENPQVGDYAEHFKVGDCVIYRKQGVIMMRIYSHRNYNFDTVEERFTVNADGELETENIDSKDGYVNNFGEWIRFDVDGNPSKTGTHWNANGVSLVANDEGLEYDENLLEFWKPRKLIDIDLESSLFNPEVNNSYKENDKYTVAYPLGYENVMNEKWNEENTGYVDYPKEVIKVRSVNFPREYFIEGTKTMNINEKNGNIKTKRNTFSRLKEVNFL